MVAPQPILRKCFQLTSGDRYLRTSRWNLALPAAKTDYYRKSFAYTGAKVWNALQDKLKCGRSVRGIKDRLDSLNLSIEI